jgi:hypothetical protein
MLVRPSALLPHAANFGLVSFGATITKIGKGSSSTEPADDELMIFTV